MITDERLRWLSIPDYLPSEPGQIAAELLSARARIRELEARWEGYMKLAPDNGVERICELEAALRNLYNERDDQDTVEHAEAVEEAERLLCPPSETEPSAMEIAQREADEAAGDNDPRDRVWGSSRETSVKPPCKQCGKVPEPYCDLPECGYAEQETACERKGHVWVEVGPPEAPWNKCDECGATKKISAERLPMTGAYGPTATCKHGIHPYTCTRGCDPHSHIDRSAKP
jgi:hypothetical protein